MAEPLKNAFGRNVVEALAARVAAVHPAFDAAAFRADASAGLAALELLDRGVHIARALARHLPRDYGAALEVLVASLGPPLPEAEDGFDGLGQGMSPFVYLPIVAFIRDHGPEHPHAFDASMAAQHALTRRFTAEWSIRPFLERWPERTLAVLAGWVDDPSCHVRRLVSEGTRPRLPWAARLRALQRDPAPALALLERLRDDPSEYVRRSVANHLNDVGKDHPGLLLDLAGRWLEGAPPPRRRLVRHALRSLVKQGHPRALALLGYGAAPRVAVAAAVTPARVALGGAVTVEVTLTSRTARAQRLAVDLVVHFVKARGEARPKVFKLRAIELPARGTAALAKRISLGEMSTRVHRTGRHRVEVRVNGKDFPAGAFEVVARRGPAPSKVERPPRRLSRAAR